MEEKFDKNNPEELGAIFAERLKKLPKVVQDAILSAEVAEHLRALADGKQLHLDQWGTLENEVMLTLLGFQPAEELAENIEKEVGVSADVAQELADDIFQTVFEPIRKQLERELERPDTVNLEPKEATPETKDTAVPEVTTMPQTPSEATGAQTQTAAPIAPTQPEPIAPAGERANLKPEPPKLSEHYRPGAPSHERKQVEGDPYREPIQ